MVLLLFISFYFGFQRFRARVSGLGVLITSWSRAGTFLAADRLLMLTLRLIFLIVIL